MAHSTARKMDVHAFLETCASCGAFRGEVSMPGRDQAVRVSCGCFQGRCPRCKRKLSTRPFSISSDDIDGKVWHAPHVSAHCPSCGPLYLAPHPEDLA